MGFSVLIGLVVLWLAGHAVKTDERLQRWLKRTIGGPKAFAVLGTAAICLAAFVVWLGDAGESSIVAAGILGFAGIVGLTLCVALKTIQDRSPVGAAIAFDTVSERLTASFTGREWLFREVDDWLTERTSNVSMLVGDPGAGKSAFLASLGTRLADRRGECAVATHFCRAREADTLVPQKMSDSLMAGLASASPALKEAFREATETRGAVREDPVGVFRTCVLDPIRMLGDAGPEVVVIVDGLDEAGSGQGQSIVDTLVSAARELPPRMRLIMSSRAQSSIPERFPMACTWVIEAQDHRNQNDISQYVGKRLAEPELDDRLKTGKAESADVTNLLVERSDGNFLYAVTALAGIAHGKLNPSDRSAFPRDLQALYGEFFARLFPEGDTFEQYRPVLEVLCAAQAPQCAEDLSRFLGRDPAGLRRDIHAKLHAFFPEREGVFAAFHRSIPEWLTGAGGNNSQWGITVSTGHKRIGETLVKEYDSQKSELSDYGRRYLHVHLRDAGQLSTLHIGYNRHALPLYIVSLGDSFLISRRQAEGSVFLHGHSDGLPVKTYCSLSLLFFSSRLPSSSLYRYPVFRIFDAKVIARWQGSYFFRTPDFQESTVAPYLRQYSCCVAHVCLFS